MDIRNSGLETEQPIRVLCGLGVERHIAVSRYLKQTRRSLRRLLLKTTFYSGGLGVYRRHWPLEQLSSAGEYGSFKALV